MYNYLQRSFWIHMAFKEFFLNVNRYNKNNEIKPNRTNTKFSAV